jgi:ADP-ribose pyrophosphatase YjhB (NUDIX family)
MLKKILTGAWLKAPPAVKRAGVWLTQPRFAVTAGAVVLDEAGRVLLLGHALRRGQGWGIPGGFIHAGEQPEEAVRREVREEIGLELEEVELVLVRTLTTARQVEVIFRARMKAAALGERSSSFEIDRAEWFAPDELPGELSRDQRRLIALALAGAANSAE